jgi:hypothetical protein
MAAIVFTTRDDELSNFHLEFAQFPATIGGIENNAVSIKKRAKGIQQEIVRLADPWVSLDHCEVKIEGDHLVVCDRGSKFGTFVNQQAITECAVQPGDTLQVGTTSFRVDYSQAALKSSQV